MHVLRVLAEPASPERVGRRGHVPSRPALGRPQPVPRPGVFERPELEGWLGREYVERLATFCQSAIEEWYSQRRPSPGAGWARLLRREDGAELHAPSDPELYPKVQRGRARARLPRRGVLDARVRCRPTGSHRSDVRRSGERRVPAQLQAEVFAMQNTWRTRGDHAHLVRYEDMVMRPNETLAALLEYVEVDSSPQTRRATAEPGRPGSAGAPRRDRRPRTGRDSPDDCGPEGHDRPLEEGRRRFTRGPLLGRLRRGSRRVRLHEVRPVAGQHIFRATTIGLEARLRGERRALRFGG